MFSSRNRYVVRVGIAALAMTTGAVLGGFAATAPSFATEPVQNDCALEGGVTVVVDFTDLGGEVSVGCALAEPPTGRAALEQAGFTITESQPGMICALNAMPAPCPAVFDGSFWSYWHSTVEGEWSSYLVGADSSEPTPGEVEGWRYSDGSAGPTVAPAQAAFAQPATASNAPVDVDDPAAVSTNDLLVGAAIVIVLIGLLVVWARRRRSPQHR